MANGLMEQEVPSLETCRFSEEVFRVNARELETINGEYLLEDRITPL